MIKGRINTEEEFWIVLRYHCNPRRFIQSAMMILSGTKGSGTQELGYKDFKQVFWKAREKLCLHKVQEWLQLKGQEEKP